MGTTIATIIAIIIMGVLGITKKMSIACTMLVSIVIMLIFNVITFEDAFSDFGSNTVITFIGMSIVSSALVETGLLEKICGFLLKIGKKEKLLVIIILIVSSFVAAFVSNRVTILLFVTILYELQRKNNDILPKKFSILILISTSIGGLFMVPTTSTLLISSNILVNLGYNGFKAMQFAPFAVFQLIILLIYYFTLSKFLFKKVSKEFKDVENLQLNKNINSNNKKQTLAVVILLLCIGFFVFTKIKTGIIAITAAMSCIIFKLIDDKKAIKSVNWEIVIMIACAGGISRALVKSGISSYIANNIFSFLNENTSKVIIVATISGIIMITTNFLTMTASASLYIPISIMLANRLGLDPMIIAMLVTISAYSSYITPLSSRNAIVLNNSDIKVKDLIIVNGPFMLILYILNIIIFSIIL